jgi:chromosome segregation ATPase
MSENKLPPKPPGNHPVSKDTENHDPNSENNIKNPNSAIQKEITKQKSFSLTRKKGNETHKAEELAHRHQLKELTRAALRHDRHARAEELERKDINQINSEISAKQLQDDSEAQAQLDALAKASSEGNAAAISAAIIDAENRLQTVNQRMAVLEKKIAKLEKHDQDLEYKCGESEEKLKELKFELTETKTLLNREHRESDRLEIDKAIKQSVADSYLEGINISDEDSIEDKAAKITESWEAERDSMESELDEMDKNLSRLEKEINDTQTKLEAEKDPTQQAEIKAALSELEANHKQLEDDRWMRGLNFAGVNSALDSDADAYIRHQARAERTEAYHQKTKEKINALETKLSDINNRHAEISEILANDRKEQLLTKQQIQQLKSEYEAEVKEKTKIEAELKDLKAVSAGQAVEIKGNDALRELEQKKDSLAKIQKQVIGMSQNALPNLENKLEALEKKIENIKQNNPQSPQLLKLEKQQDNLIKKIDKTQSQISKKQQEIVEKKETIAKLEATLNKKAEPETELSLLDKFRATAAALDAEHNHHSPHPLNHKAIVPKFEQSKEAAKEARKSADNSPDKPEPTMTPRKSSHKSK